MNLKTPLINDLKNILKNESVLDVVIFGSAAKGKINPDDIDAAVICKKEIKIELEGAHISIISINDFFIKPVSLINTLLREGYSLRHNKPFSEVFKFSAKLMFFYELNGLSASDKVRLVNILRGKDSLVERYNGEWLTRQVFFMPAENEKLFEDLFLKFGAKYKKNYLLMH
ncbi:nucleotidyltransferase domain-containing protein [Candidatus Woesearchaeota archaeon]|nr:nucleotidyltransferase domain-containing protein [Candidatus Woesearchaeota archaeon]